MPFESLISFLKKIIPNRIVRTLAPAYHWLWSFGSALYYRFPGKQLIVVLITGTKGKTTTAELINAIFESGNYRTGLGSTLRFKAFDNEERNKFKMSVPGRGIIQKFLRSCVNEGCDVAIMEMTSQAVLDSRHRFLFPNVLVFTNLEPEHIEAHGSYANYLEAKLKIATELKKSSKAKKAIVSNLDDAEGRKFITRSFSFDVKDYSYSLDEEADKLYLKNGVRFTYKDTRYISALNGKHNAKNILAAIKVAEFFTITPERINEGLCNLNMVRGRLQEIETKDNSKVRVFVDYAHTPESLRAVYNTFPENNIVGVLGNTGGGRDTWKRSEMAKIAESYCSHIFLTDEDPYDEDPATIIDEMYQAIDDKDKVVIEMDRRKAINQALKIAHDLPKNTNPVIVLITGKGTDPYIMRANGKREEWDDASVVREELEKLY